MRYNQTSSYNHDEVPARKNIKTGKFQELKKKPNNIPEGKEFFEPKGFNWRKKFDQSWEFLDEVLTDLELRVVGKMCRMAEENTNSLKPLNDEYSINEIAKELNIGRNKVSPMFKKFFELGIYAKFEAFKPDIPYTKWWVLNPYLEFKGKIIDSDIARLFEGTVLHKEYIKRVFAR